MSAYLGTTTIKTDDDSVVWVDFFDEGLVLIVGRWKQVTSILFAGSL